MAVSDPKLNDFTMMLVIHDAFRRDLARIGTVLAEAEHGTVGSARAQAVLGRWRWMSDQIHHHHSGEDAALWPALRAAVRDDPTVLRVLDHMEDEHRHLAPRQAEFDRALAAFAATPAPPEAQAAGRAWRAFSELFTAHLAHEERDAVPVLEHRLPPAALRRFEAGQQRALGLRVAMRQFFPWLLDGTTPQRRAHVLGELPAPLRWLVLRAVPGYRRRTAPAWT